MQPPVQQWLLLFKCSLGPDLALGGAAEVGGRGAFAPEAAAAKGF